MARKVLTPRSEKAKDLAANGAPERGALDADIIIANAPDPVFVSDLEGKILQANDAVSQLLGFRQDEVHRAVALALHQRRRRPASSPRPCARSSSTA